MIVAGGVTRPVAWTRAGWLAGIALLLGLAVAEFVTLYGMAATHHVAFGLGGVPPASDYTLYMDRTRSWLAGDGFYLPRQLAGPYPIMHGDATYPPVALLLFVPFTVLPAVLWWAVPIGIVAAALWHIRPPLPAATLLALVAAFPRTSELVLYGNPSMWALAFLVAGAAWRWPAALAPLKVTLAPFALVGVRHRSWWVAGAVGLALCVPFGAMWLDYLSALRDAQPTPTYGLGYVLGDWPVALGLVVACYTPGKVFAVFQTRR